RRSLSVSKCFCVFCACEKTTSKQNRRPKSDRVLLMRGVRMQREIRQLPVLNSFRWTLNKKQIYPGFRNIESDFINPIVEWSRNLPLLPRSRWKKYKHTYVFQSVHRPFGFGVSESKSNLVILACAERYVL